MSADIAFKIQLGIILPKLKENVGSNLSTIIEDLVTILQAGSLEGDEPISLDAVKEIIMKDLEIFLDDAIFPVIDAKLNPPQPEEAAESEAEAEEPAEPAE
jgi:hypothetical protein